MKPQHSPESRPRHGGAVLLAALLALAGLLWAGRAQLPEHLARWTAGGARADLTLDHARLSPALDAAGLAQLLGGLPLPCQALPDGSVCEAALNQANGIAASRLRATWQQDRLQTVDILLPWWKHHATVGMLLQRLGPPGSRAPLSTEGQHVEALAWKLPRGTVQIARAPGWNPLHWTVLRWTASPGAAAR